MHHTTRSFAAVILVTVVTVVTMTSACHFADVDAIEQHMLRECFTVPLAPTCSTAVGNDEQARVVFERFAQRSVTRAETEACILAVDCSDERFREDIDGAVDELQSCIASDPGSQSIDEDRAARETRCLEDCDTDLLACGDIGCAVPTVRACFAEHDSCVSACPKT